MSVCGELPVDRAAELESVDDRRRAEVDELADLLSDLVVVDLSGSERVDHDRDRLCDADSVGDLNLALGREPCRDDVLRDVARGVGRGTVDLRRSLPENAPPP